MFITRSVTAAPDVPARHGRHAGAAAARRDGAGADGAAKTAASPQRASGSSTSRTASSWTSGRPTTAGADFELTPILKPLEPFRDSLVVVSNLARPTQTTATTPCAPASLAHRRAAEADRRRRTSGPARRSISWWPGRSARTRRSRRSRSPPRISPACVGACDPGYSCAYMNTLIWQTPTTPLPMEINPRVVFERLFGGGDDARSSGWRGCATDRSILDLGHGRSRRPRSAASARAIGRGSTSIWSTSARSSGASSAPSSRRDTQLTVPIAPVGVPESFEEHVGADVRPAGAGLPGRSHARLHVHDGARGQPADVSADRRHRAAPRDLASRQQAGQDRGAHQGQHLPRAAVREVPRAAARRRPTATARCSITR